ncbi:MAG: hypothetical protein ACJAR0_001525 [Candidatus Azotimanducaceae bacterium]|jgi:hypothetical protein
MKIVYWLIGLVVIVATLPILIIYGASELGGEVVTLDRAELEGDPSRIRIWIVDQQDSSWIEHSDADSFWMTQLTESANVVLDRGGQTVNYIGTPDRDSHDLYHQLRREKYGWADKTIAFLSGGDAECEGVPVRLESLLK